uniref:Uncharacterized protein n=1 Tax=Melanopsichium pennsylvanicum 4 TaxID=1398559 RepID=A0A077QZT8_9BASI|nr:uncharacterized protein BN887_06218 [Melanopsichium pennsylvanicum 4]
MRWSVQYGRTLLLLIRPDCKGRRSISVLSSEITSATASRALGDQTFFAGSYASQIVGDVGCDPLTTLRAKSRSFPTSLGRDEKGPRPEVVKHVSYEHEDLVLTGAFDASPVPPQSPGEVQRPSLLLSYKSETEDP